MRTTIIVNSLKELKTCANFYGIEVKSSEIVVSFPYRFEITDIWIEKDEMSFEEFRLRYM